MPKLNKFNLVYIYKILKLITRPYNEDAPPWCPYFFELVKEGNLIEAFQNNKQKVLGLIGSIPFAKEEFKYDPDKWSIKDVFIHMNDTERFYSYRAFCSSRKMDIDLEFDPNQDIYARNSNAVDRTLEDIAEEFAAVREASISLFTTMNDDMLDFKGFPNKMVYTARSLGWMTVGHNIHHCNIIEEKYLKSGLH